MKKIFLLTICLSTCLCIKAQDKAADYKEQIKVINKNVYDHFYDAPNNLFFETEKSSPQKKPHSYLWPLCAQLQAANEMQVLEPKKDCISPVMKAIDQYYSDLNNIPAYQASVAKAEKDDRFYDDNEWVAIALLDAYDHTHKSHYLDISKMIYHFLMTGKDTAGGGGLYWKEGDLHGKNTCSNGPGILVALHLYQITKDKQYLDVALDIYRWTNAHLRAPNGIFYDNIGIPSGKLGRAFFTYNAGTMLQSNVVLYNITGDKKYLTEAQRIATAARERFFVNGRLPSNYWFNAVMLRGYIDLYKIDHNDSWIDFFRTDADGVWKDERDKDNLLGKNQLKALIDQGGMLEIYSRLQQVKQMKK